MHRNGVQSAGASAAPGATLGGAPIGIPIGSIVTFGDPDGDKAPVDRDTEIGIGVAHEDAILSSAIIVRYQRRKGIGCALPEIVPQPLVLEFPVIRILDLKHGERDYAARRVADRAAWRPPSSSQRGGAGLVDVGDAATAKLEKQT